MLKHVIRNLRTGIRLVGLFVLGAAIVGCGNNTDKAPNNVPEWYLNTPEDPNYLYAANSATSQKMQVAIDKATNGARADLASNLETKIESMTKSFTEEVGDNLRQQYTEATKAITSKVLRGTSPKEKDVFQKDNGTWRAFVLMELPVGEAAKKFMQKLNNRDKEMYTRFRSSQAFKEMKKAVDEYEKEQKKGMSGSQK